MKFIKSLFYVVMMIVIFSATFPASSVEQIKKKFVFIKDDDSDFFNGFAGYIESQIRTKGYTAEKCDYVVLSMHGNGSNGSAVLKEVQTHKPDVVFINCVYMKEMNLLLRDANIPTVVVSMIDFEEDNGKKAFINDKGFPSGSVVGIYGGIQDVELNTFKLLNRIAPLNGKKIGILIGHDLVNLKSLKKAASTFGASLKIYEKVKYSEDMKTLIDSANNDRETGWILMYPPFNSKTGKNINREENFKLLYTAVNKPNITYWQNDVERGAFMAITNDSTGMVLQCLEMAYRILEGEKPGNIKPEYPKKSLLLFNYASAQRIGITIPPDIMDGAWRIYTDYEGHYIGQK